MRKITATLIVLSICCCFQASAQSATGDSMRIYRSRINRIYRQTWDSLRKSDSLVYYHQRLQKAINRSRGYFAFDLYTTVGKADFSVINKAIAKDGFGPLTGPAWGVGLGFTTRADNGAFLDFNFATFGLNRTVKKGDESITANYGSVFQFNWGVAVVNGRVFSLYPYLGLSLRFTDLNYSKPQSVNPNWNSIASIVQNNQAVTTENGHLSYQAGLAMDLLLTNPDNSGGIMLFGKFGTDGIFGHENFDIYGVKYSSGMKFGAWEATMGIKFMGRK